MLRFFRAVRKRLLETSRMREYLLYAVGEVVLVVVGILIALQVNNWNERRQQDRLAAAYTASVVDDLRKDSLVIHQYVEYVRREVALYEGYRARLDQAAATVDTLVRIARWEFDPVADQLPTFNNNTFESIESSGNLLLLEPWLSDALIELNRRQKYAIDVEKVVNTLYYPTTSSYGMRYPLRSALRDSGPLDDLVWDNIDAVDLASSFNAVASLKNVKVVWEESVLRDVADQVNRILARLREDGE